MQLGEMVKDLASLVADQGTLLDRIDYNIEQAEHHVAQGVEELNQVCGAFTEALGRHCYLTFDEQGAMSDETQFFASYY